MKDYFEAHPTLHGYLTLCSLDSCSLVNSETSFLKTQGFLTDSSMLLVSFQVYSLPGTRRTGSRDGFAWFETVDEIALHTPTTFLLEHADTTQHAINFVANQLADILRNIGLHSSRLANSMNG